MEQTFWLERWAANQIGFHREETHPLLQRHWSALGVAAGSRVLVPLCGKSLDMAWLAAEGHTVLGVELSPVAIRAFFAERGITPESSTTDGFLALRSGAITLLSGDFFALSPELVQPIEAVYDRAALVALPAEMRKQYAQTLATLAAAPTLLITLDYDQSQMPGPPFAVTPSEVRALYEERYRVRVLEGPLDVLEQEPKFAERGVSGLEETVFLLMPR